jgi:hypothetical protein
LFEETDQISFDGIQTKNFDICPSAFKEFSKLIPVVSSLPPPVTGRSSPTARQMKLRNFLD